MAIVIITFLDGKQLEIADGDKKDAMELIRCIAEEKTYFSDISNRGLFVPKNKVRHIIIQGSNGVVRQEIPDTKTASRIKEK